MKKVYCALISTLAVLVVLAVAPTPAQADTIFSNFGSATSFSNGLAVCGSCGPYDSSIQAGDPEYLATSFTPSADFTLSEIDVPLGRYSGTNGATVELLNDASGLPGSTILESWTLTNLPGSSTTFTPQSLTSSGGVSLSSGVQYWVAVFPEDSTSWIDWSTNTLNPAESGYAYNFGYGWASYDYTTPAFQVLGTPAAVATPEPASLTLLGAGLLGLAGVELLRRKSLLA